MVFSSSSSPSRPAYRADIDGLRAIAILLVCIFHFRLFPFGQAGFIGVDLFFVISGFLITRILVTDLDKGQFHLGGFYLARLRRLMPALMATLVLYLVAAYIVFLPEQFTELSIEVLLSQLYVVNIYFWRSINYFGLQAETVPLLHMWSLALEEQFYIFYPLFLLLVCRFARKYLLLIALVLCVASFVLGVIATGWKPQASFYLLPTRAWELMAGGLVALTAPVGLLRSNLARLCGPTGMIIIVIALIFHTPVTPFPGWFAALPVAAGVFLILGGANAPVGRALGWSPFVWIGKISYPLYLVHWPIIILTHDLFESHTRFLGWAGFIVSILIAWGIWAFIETPVRTKRIFKEPRTFLRAAIVMTVSLGAAGVFGWVNQGLPQRFSPQVQSILAFAEDGPVPFVNCELSERENKRNSCPLGPEGAPPKVMIIGDSHAQAFAGAADLWLQRSDTPGELYFHSGCIPLLGIEHSKCGWFLNTALAALANTPSIKDVLLISSWRHDPSTFNGHYLHGSAADKAFEEALEQTLKPLRNAGVTVWLVDPMFFASNRAPQTLARNLHFGSAWPVDRSRASYNTQNATVLAAFAAAAKSSDVQQVSLINDLCADGICKATWNNTPVFSDNNHIRFGMSDYFAGQFEAAFQ